MTLTDFRTLIRMYVPLAKITKITNTTLNTLFNKAVDDVNVYAMAYKGNKKFTATADDGEYDIHTEIDDYMAIDESGLWWNNGTNWKKLEPMTRRSLDDEYSTWRNDSSGNPLRYFIEQDKIEIHPKPDTTLVDGFWIFYTKVAVSMTLDTHYPFTGSTTEITALRILDDAIIDYVRWKLSGPLGNTKKGILTEKEYRTNLAEKISLLTRRLDLTASLDNRMQGPAIGE